MRHLCKDNIRNSDFFASNRGSPYVLTRDIKIKSWSHVFNYDPHPDSKLKTQSHFFNYNPTPDLAGSGRRTSNSVTFCRSQADPMPCQDSDGPGREHALHARRDPGRAAGRLPFAEGLLLRLSSPRCLCGAPRARLRGRCSNRAVHSAWQTTV